MSAYVIMHVSIVVNFVTPHAQFYLPYQLQRCNHSSEIALL